MCKSVNVQGTVYPTILSACAAIQVSTSAVYAFSKRNDVSIQDALNAIYSRKKSFTVRGVNYKPYALRVMRSPYISIVLPGLVNTMGFPSRKL